MEILAVDNISFQYPDMDEYVLNHVSMHVSEGDFVVVCGPSGCGKTTLLRLLKHELAPVGKQSGSITYAGKNIIDYDERTLIEEIGLVFQDPENQIVMDEVMQEIVFGMENLGYSNFEMRKRVAEMVHFFGMEDLLDAKPSELSGGQKQMLNLLSVLLLKPKVLLLDEPTSQLDPVAAKDLIVMLERLNKEMGMTIIIVEHRLEELFAIADQVVMLEKGAITYKGTSREVIESVYTNGDKQFIPYIPSVARLYLSEEKDPMQLAIPLTVKESKAWLASLDSKPKETYEQPTESNDKHTKPLLSVKKAYFQYERHSPMILKNLSLDIHPGEFFALVGGNGSGKTTLLKLCIGMIKAQRGSAKFVGKDVHKLKGKELYERMAYLPQNPQTYFVQDTIEKEMRSVLEQNNIQGGEQKMTNMLALFGIRHLRHRHPYDCSGGELQRAALACMLLAQPDILFVDEPTKGLDPIAKENFANVLKDLHAKGLTIVMVTHDIEFAAKHVERCAMLFDGEVTVGGTPDHLFKGNYFYTTAINRATRLSNRPEVLTLEEAFDQW